MRVKILILVGALLLSLTGSPSGFAQKKAPTKTPAASAKKPTTSVKKKAPVRRAARRPVRRATTARRAPAPTNQRVPTRDRYTEIQQALADAGHFTGEPDGNWNQASIEAMKAFQADQGFEPTGRIDSRSLIKLGLGPQYDAVRSEPPATPPATDARQPG